MLQNSNDEQRIYQLSQKGMAKPCCVTKVLYESIMNPSRGMPFSHGYPCLSLGRDDEIVFTWRELMWRWETMGQRQEGASRYGHVLSWQQWADQIQALIKAYRITCRRFSHFYRYEKNYHERWEGKWEWLDNRLFTCILTCSGGSVLHQQLVLKCILPWGGSMGD